MTLTENRIHIGILIILGFIGINVVVGAYQVSPLSRQAPYAYISALAITPSVAAGESLSLRYTFDRFRYCRTDLDRFIIRASDNDVVWRDRVPAGAGTLGRTTVINEIPIPSNLKVGSYIARAISYATCSDHLYDLIAPDVTFEIVKKAAN